MASGRSDRPEASPLAQPVAIEQGGQRSAKDVALSVRNLSKAFPGTQALSSVALEVPPGELHALLGGNGSGKSTLIKILAGVHRADPGGAIRVHQRELDAQAITPSLAQRIGLRFVHQQAAVFEELSIAENLFLDRSLPSRVGRVQWKRLNAQARQILERFRIAASPSTPLRALRPSTQTMVAIARALKDSDEVKDTVLVLDEPTATLPEAEVDLLLEALTGYAQAGHTILYVTHRLTEAVQVADGATVLRDGRVAARLVKEEITEGALVAHITGGRGAERAPRAGKTRGEVVFAAEDVSGPPLRGATLEIRAGDVVGLAGLLGSGRTALLEMAFGVRPIGGGKLHYRGKPWRPKRPDDAISHGIVYVPEDRARQGIFPDLTVARNLSAPAQRHYRRFGRVASGLEAADARAAIGQYAIKARSERDLVALLSGGNQQKVLLARWLARSPSLILLDEPTQGVDVGARVELHAAIREAADAGAGVLLVSSDLIELAEYSDRVLVVREGRIVAELTAADLDPHVITEALHASERSRSDDPSK